MRSIGLEVGVAVLVEDVAVGDPPVDPADGEAAKPIPGLRPFRAAFGVPFRSWQNGHLGKPPGGVVRVLAVD